MISAISGLPDLVIDKHNDVQIDIELSKRPKVDKMKIEQETPKEKAKVESSKDKLFNQDSIDNLNKEIKSIMDGNNLFVEFRFEKEANQLIMKLIDEETKEVVRQVPAEVMLKIARIISSQIGTGALADAKV
jgi:flagellar protein FlaG